jgi:hypothetical protein
MVHFISPPGPSQMNTEFRVANVTLALQLDDPDGKTIQTVFAVVGSRGKEIQN